MNPKKEMIYAGLSNGSICKWASRSADPTVRVFLGCSEDDY